MFKGLSVIVLSVALAACAPTVTRYNWHEGDNSGRAEQLQQDYAACMYQVRMAFAGKPQAFVYEQMNAARDECMRSKGWIKEG